MTTRIVTLMWGTAWERYGEKFASTFFRHWPGDVEFAVVTDRLLPVDRAQQFMLQCVPGYGDFMRRWKDDRQANGFDSGARKIDAHGKSWKHDAVKWAPQGLAPRAALNGLADGDLLVWFDADVETTGTVPEGWVDSLIGDSDVVCLQRQDQHSEIGFWAVRVGPCTRKMVEIFANLYASGAVFRLPEYHSAYVFDRALESVSGLKIKSLSPKGARGHVWPSTPLAAYTAHKKGKIKDQ